MNLQKKLINVNPASLLRRGWLVVPLLIALCGLSPVALAVSPAPDGGYAGANTAEGTQALQSRTTGLFNTALGFQALFHLTDGHFNMATGFKALFNNTGDRDVGIGVNALLANTIGDSNVAVGTNALFRNISGDRNIAVGDSAGFNLTIGDDNIDIGNAGVAAETETIRIGTSGIQHRAFIAGIRGVAVTGSTVVVSASGQLGVLPSSARFKDEIKPMDKASEAIFALKPVTFHYTKGIDPDRTAQFGLVAEEVEKVNPSLVTRDAKGEVYTVRYDAVNAMLLNEFLKEHRTVEQQEATITQVKSTAAKQEATISQLRSTVAKQEVTIAQQQKGMEAVTARLEEQASQIQKVSYQLELSKPAPRTVSNNQ